MVGSRTPLSQAILLFVMISCKNSGPLTPQPIEIANVSSAQGFVYLEEVEDTTNPDLSGIQIQLGLDRFTTSTNDGSYLFDSVTPGVYPVLMSKSGYDTAFVQQVVVHGPSSTVIPTRGLQKTRTLDVRFDSVTYEPAVAWLHLADSLQSRTPYLEFIVFLSKAPDVSAACEEHDLALPVYWAKSHSPSKKFGLSFDQFWVTNSRQPGKTRLKAGDSAYAMVYVREVSELFTTVPFYEPNSPRYRYLNLVSPSNTIGFIVP